MALHVCDWWVARPLAGLGATRGDGTGTLETKGRSRASLANLAAVCGTFFECAAAQNDSEFVVHVGVDLRPLGRNRVRSGCGDGAGGSDGQSWSASGAACFARDHVGFVRDDSRLPGDALAGGAIRKARCAGFLFCTDADVYRADVWKSLLPRCGCAAVVFRLPFLPRIWRREFCRVHALAAGAVPDGVPRERVCVFHFLRPLRGRRDHVSCRRRRAAIRVTGNPRGADFDRFRDWLAADSFWCGNARPVPASVTRSKRETMADVETNVFPIEALREFCTRVFLHFGVPTNDAVRAADVLACADLRGIDSHGVARLHSYFDMLTLGRINPKPRIKMVRSAPSTATVDGDNGLGLVVGPQANRMARDIAEKNGSGWVSVRNTNHFGIAGYYVLKALERDLIGWAMTNSTKLVAPLWGAERMLGTNPIAIAFPGLEEPAIVIDMATTAAAYGKIEIARRAK